MYPFVSADRARDLVVSRGWFLVRVGLSHAVWEQTIQEVEP
jgi:hypothetical protein